MNPTLIVGSTELAGSNVPRQLESLYIKHQRVVGIESEVAQRRRLTLAESLNRRQAAGERAILRSSQTHGSGTARSEEPPGTWHLILSQTQQPLNETVPVGKDSNSVFPERLHRLALPPYKVYEVDIRLGTTFHFRVDAEERNAVLQNAPAYHISAYVDMRYVLIQREPVMADVKGFSGSIPILED